MYSTVPDANFLSTTKELTDKLDDLTSLAPFVDTGELVNLDLSAGDLDIPLDFGDFKEMTMDMFGSDDKCCPPCYHAGQSSPYENFANFTTGYNNPNFHSPHEDLLASFLIPGSGFSFEDHLSSVLSSSSKQPHRCDHQSTDNVNCSSASNEAPLHQKPGYYMPYNQAVRFDPGTSSTSAAFRELYGLEPDYSTSVSSGSGIKDGVGTSNCPSKDHRSQAQQQVGSGPSPSTAFHTTCKVDADVVDRSAHSFFNQYNDDSSLHFDMSDNTCMLAEALLATPNVKRRGHEPDPFLGQPFSTTRANGATGRTTIKSECDDWWPTDSDLVSLTNDRRLSSTDDIDDMYASAVVCLGDAGQHKTPLSSAKARAVIDDAGHGYARSDQGLHEIVQRNTLTYEPVKGVSASRLMPSSIPTNSSITTTRTFSPGVTAYPSPSPYAQQLAAHQNFYSQKKSRLDSAKHKVIGVQANGLSSRTPVTSPLASGNPTTVVHGISVATTASSFTPDPYLAGTTTAASSSTGRSTTAPPIRIRETRRPFTVSASTYNYGGAIRRLSPSALSMTGGSSGVAAKMPAGISCYTPPLCPSPRANANRNLEQQKSTTSSSGVPAGIRTVLHSQVPGISAQSSYPYYNSNFETNGMDFQTIGSDYRLRTGRNAPLPYNGLPAKRQASPSSGLQVAPPKMLKSNNGAATSIVAGRPSKYVLGVGGNSGEVANNFGMFSVTPRQSHHQQIVVGSTTNKKGEPSLKVRQLSSMSGGISLITSGGSSFASLAPFDQPFNNKYTVEAI